MEVFWEPGTECCDLDLECPDKYQRWVIGSQGPSSNNELLAKCAVGAPWLAQVCLQTCLRRLHQLLLLLASCPEVNSFPLEHPSTVFLP